MRTLLAVAVFASIVFLAACGGSSSSESSSDENEATATTMETTMETSGETSSTASISASGAASGTFDTVTDCSTTRGGGEMLVITVSGSLDGSPATLTIDQETFTPDAYVYPLATFPAPGTELSSDVAYDNDTTKGAWQFFPVQPAGLRGDAGGTIGIVEKSGDILDVTIDAKYGTTDASGPLALKGELTCTATS